MQTFSELSVSPSLKERLKASQFVTPTPVQAAAIPQALAGADVIATAQTGTGKTPHRRKPPQRAPDAVLLRDHGGGSNPVGETLHAEFRPPRVCLHIEALGERAFASLRSA